jgi:hypothetical protein
MVEAARILQRQRAEFEFLLPVASTLSLDWLCEQLQTQGLKPLVDDDPDAALKSRSSTENRFSVEGRSSTEAFASTTGQDSVMGSSQNSDTAASEQPTSVMGSSRPSGSSRPGQPSTAARWSRPLGLREEPLDTPALAAGVKPEAPLIHLTHNTAATLKHARAAVVASGTATVEAALSGTPFVVVYRLAPLTWLLGRRLVKLDTFAMPNLIAGKKIVPELIQKDFTAQNVLKELNAIIQDGPARQQMEADLKMVQQRLRDSQRTDSPAQRAAREILGALTTA